MMGRPSPRTQGIDEEGEPFQKFGTQQLEYIDPINPALGVVEKNVGESFKGFTTSGYTGTKTTVFSERFQSGITGATPISMREEAIVRQQEKLDEMELDDLIPTLPTLDDLFPPEPIDKNGCECEACKNGIGQCSDKCGKCDAWDLGCEATCGLTVPPNTLLWVKIILAVIGIGILLWLLRPLFSMIGAFKGGAV